VRDVWLRTGLPPRVLERLADADAFSSLGLSRRDALWAAKALGRVGDRDDDLPLFAAPRVPGAAQPQALFTSPRLRGEVGEQQSCEPDEGASRGAQAVDLSPQAGRGESMREPDVALPPMPIGEEVVNDYRFLRLSLRAHPAQFLRDDLSQRGILRNEALRSTASGARATVSGLVTCRQRPGSANGVIFMTIEDESAMANIIVWPKTFERLRPVVLGARYVSVRGKVQEECGVIHVVAEHIEDLTHMLGRLTEHGMEIDGLARCDEVRRPVEELRKARADGGRESRLERLVREVPELAADLDTPARGSAHAPSRKAG
jgi:error-prone DNA polymerase